MARKSLSELREEMRAVARGERKASPLPAAPLLAALSREALELLAVLLRKHPANVSELAELTGRAQPNISRSLSSWPDTGLGVKARFTEPGELLMNPKDLHAIEEARELLGGISRNSVYHLLRDGRLASVLIGRRRLISTVAIEAFIAASTTTEPPDAERGRIPRRRALQMRLKLKAPLVPRSRDQLPDH